MTDTIDSREFLPLRFAGNQLVVQMEAASDTITDRSGLDYRLKLMIPAAYQSGTYEQLTMLTGRENPAEAGQAVWASFDVDKLIDSLLERQVPVTASPARIIPVPGVTMPFYTKTQVFNNNLAVTTEITNPTQVVLKGRLSTEQFAGWKEAFFSVHLANTRQFLTWSPVEKTVDVAQPEWLYYLVNFTPKPEKLRLRAEITFDDGTVDTVTLLEQTGVSQYTVYSMPVGFTQLNLSGYETADKLVFSYRVWVADQANKRLSEIRTYYVATGTPRQVRYIIFANSLGGFDTLRCIGTASEQLKIDSIQSRRPLPVDYLSSSAELFAQSKTAERMLTVNTGYQDDPDVLNYLQELALSEEVYIMAQEGLVAILVGSDSYNLRADGENLGGRTFSFRYAKPEVGYSRLPVLPNLTGSRPTIWQPEGAYCLVDPLTGLRTGLMGAARLKLFYADTMNPVPGVRTKTNTPGTEGYYAPVESAGCAPSTTPFRNSLVTATGSYIRNNCGTMALGAPATISIAANTLGGETADELTARITNYISILDTQAYANSHGSCDATPWIYTRSIPSGQWNIRSNAPAALGVLSYFSGDFGNTWERQPYVGVNPFNYSSGSNDMLYPVPDPTFNWTYRLFFDTLGGLYTQMAIYKNGVQVFAYDIVEIGGWYQLSWISNPADQDKWYVLFYN